MLTRCDKCGSVHSGTSLLCRDCYISLKATPGPTPMTVDPKDAEIADLVAELTRAPGWPTLARRAVDTIKALTAELREARMQILASDGQAQMAYEAEQKAETERDAALAQVTEQRMDVVAMAEMAASLIEDMSKKPGTTWGQVKAAVRALGDLGDRSALSRRDAQMRAEGMRKAACIQKTPEFGSDWLGMSCAILAAAEKEAGNG